MPQAKRSTSTRAASKFKQPPALKRLTTSLDSAQKAIAELSKGGGRDVSKGAKDLYTDLRKFVGDAHRSSTKLGKALQRDFDQAQKQLAKAKPSATRSTATRTTAKRTTAKRTTAKRTTAARSTAGRSASTRSTSARSTTRRASGTAKRASGGASKRGTTKS